MRCSTSPNSPAEKTQQHENKIAAPTASDLKTDCPKQAANSVCSPSSACSMNSEFRTCSDSRSHTEPDLTKKHLSNRIDCTSTDHHQTKNQRTSEVNDDQDPTNCDIDTFIKPETSLVSEYWSDRVHEIGLSQTDNLVELCSYGTDVPVG